MYTSSGLMTNWVVVAFGSWALVPRVLRFRY